MKKLLIGMIGDGTFGGVDKYILGIYRGLREHYGDQLQIDLLTNVPQNPLADRLAAEGSRVHCISRLSHPLRQYREVCELIDTFGYDGVYLNASTALSYPILKAAARCGVKTVLWHSHSSGFDHKNPVIRLGMTALQTLCKHRACRYATHFLSCSDMAANWMFPSYVCRSGKVICIPNAVDTLQFQFNEQQRAALRCQLAVEDKFVIGTVGNLLYVKNHEFLLRVMETLSHSAPDAVLLILGEGPLHSRLSRQIEKHGLQDTVRLLGRKDTAEGYMSAFDVFVLPSFFEGMPIVLVEAQCSRLPCVVSNRVTREACIGGSCEFVPITDATAWAKALLRYRDLPREEIPLPPNKNHFDYTQQLRALCAVIEEKKEGAV